MTSFIGLFIASLSEIIFLTLILLNLLSSPELVFVNVIKKELPSLRILLFNSKISENKNNSKTPLKSDNLTIA